MEDCKTRKLVDRQGSSCLPPCQQAVKFSDQQLKGTRMFDGYADAGRVNLRPSCPLCSMRAASSGWGEKAGEVDDQGKGALCTPEQCW